MTTTVTTKTSRHHFSHVDIMTAQSSCMHTPLRRMSFTTLAGKHLLLKVHTICTSWTTLQNTGILSQNLLPRRPWLSCQHSRSLVGRCPNNDCLLLAQYRYNCF